ncbi:MAG: DoxX family protein [Candidatus Nanopelagicales bacterium]|nr:DoxX family protein [Candidatus Nanopelagicales bacterium]
MSYAVWILQFLLAFAFVAAGLTKLFTPRVKLSKRMAWAKSVDPRLIKLIGTLEVLGGLGLFLPPILPSIPTIFTLLATIGLGLLMLGAIVTHIRLKEAREATPALILLLFLVLLACSLFAVDRY